MKEIKAYYSYDMVHDKSHVLVRVGNGVPITLFVDPFESESLEIAKLTKLFKSIEGQSFDFKYRGWGREITHDDAPLFFEKVGEALKIANA